MDKFDVLKLENQLCFPLYAASRKVIKLYRPYLKELGLTYTQYISMMVFWEDKRINVKNLGEKLFLDSGTLTLVLKNLEDKGYVKRRRSPNDNRELSVEITEAGEALKERAVSIPAKIVGCINMDKEEALQLYRLLYKALSPPEDTNE